MEKAQKTITKLLTLKSANLDLIKENDSILVCSHNPIIPRIVEKLSRKLELEFKIDKLQPGDAWVIHHAVS